MKKKTNGPKSVRTTARRARRTAHDTLGVEDDLLMRGALQYTELVRALAGRFVQEFESSEDPNDSTVGTDIWEPIARRIVRTMVCALCNGAKRMDDGVERYVAEDIQFIAGAQIAAPHQARKHAFDDAWRLIVADITAEVFSDHVWFARPAALRCTDDAYIFHRDGDMLVVREGGI